MTTASTDATTPTAAITPTSTPSIRRPALQREVRAKDGTISHVDAERDDFERRDFSLDIKSVYYYPGQNGTTCCAVLVTVRFILDRGQKLETAIIPLGVRATLSDLQADSSDPGSIVELGAYYPSKEQKLVSERQVFRRTEFRPSVKVTTPVGVEAELGGMGFESKETVISSETILYPTQYMKTNDETVPEFVKWIYRPPRQSRRLDYPHDLDLIVVAEQSNSTQSWFPFTLHIGKELGVYLRGLPGVLRAAARLVSNSPPNNGWVFKIAGGYRPERVKGVLKNDDLHAQVGLKV